MEAGWYLYDVQFTVALKGLVLPLHSLCFPLKPQHMMTMTMASQTLCDMSSVESCEPGHVTPLIILRLNQAYKVRVQSSVIQYQNSPKSLSEYREPMF